MPFSSKETRPVKNVQLESRNKNTALKISGIILNVHEELNSLNDLNIKLSNLAINCEKLNEIVKN